MTEKEEGCLEKTRGTCLPNGLEQTILEGWSGKDRVAEENSGAKSQREKEECRKQKNLDSFHLARGKEPREKNWYWSGK